MKRSVLKVLSLLAVIAVAFMAGKVSAPSESLPSASVSQTDLDVAWDNFIAAQNATRALIEQHAQLTGDEQTRAEGYQNLLTDMVGAITVSALHDPLVPQFTRMPDLGSKSGMDNPDNEYRMAIIRDDQDYLIRGRLTPRRALYFQSMIGQPGVGVAGPGTSIATLTSHDLVTNADGQFELHVSRDRPDGAQNWLKIDAGAEMVLVRFSDMDWPVERPTDWLTIERVCVACPQGREPMTEADAIYQLNRAAQSLHDRTASWLKIADRIWTHVPRNGMGNIRETPNGLTGQYSAFGTFDLAPDEALILTVPAAEMGYQGLQLGSLWFTSLDYRTRVSSLTRQQSKPDADGLIRYVISARDPGVWNWLDTDGRHAGLIMLRWQGVKDKPTPAPRTQKVRLEEVMTYLPEDTARISTDERGAQIQRRMQAVDLRFQ